MAKNIVKVKRVGGGGGRFSDMPTKVFFTPFLGLLFSNDITVKTHSFYLYYHGNNIIFNRDLNSLFLEKYLHISLNKLIVNIHKKMAQVNYITL